MPGKTPNSNGKEPVENGGYPGSKDIEMKDESSLKGKGKKGSKDGDEEMTVVVPPSKNSASAPPPDDADGDVDLDDAEKEGEVKVDPAAQTVAGIFFSFLPRTSRMISIESACVKLNTDSIHSS
jgi:26S proteasome regulatory subunit N3